MAFGHIPGYPVGSWFADRRALAASGVHRALQAGIVGRQDEGAESIVLSGGYVDDRDWGAELFYTGAGGRDPASQRQTGDQQLSRSNLALATSADTGQPVRVVRGQGAAHHGLDPRFRPPLNGYRYDGLYRVAHFYPSTGADGYRIWQFALTRLPEGEQDGGAALPRIAEPSLFGETVRRRAVTAQDLARDYRLAQRVKALYDFRCQACTARLETPAGPYAEAAHARPLGYPHNGPDALENLLCLCPNCRARFERFAFAVAEDRTLLGQPGVLRTDRRHGLDTAHLRYHRQLFELALEGAETQRPAGAG